MEEHDWAAYFWIDNNNNNNDEGSKVSCHQLVGLDLIIYDENMQFSRHLIGFNLRP